MYCEKKIIALIPARGGSKGVKKKNIRDLAGIPLIAYTIEAARKSKYIDKVIVSTDSEEIAEVARNCGAEIPFIRPKELAEDTTSTLAVVLHVINTLEKLNGWDSLVLLQPTQPLRTAEDVDGAIEYYYSHGEKSLVSIAEVDEHPILMRTLDNEETMKKLLDIPSTVRRQDMEKVYRVNGAIYINKISQITCETSFNDNEIGYIMEKSHSVDIDELSDFAMAEYYLSHMEIK